MLQLKYTMVKLFDVPPEAFTPAPKVMSSVVRMTPRKTVADVDENLLENVVAVGFSMRRKTLRNVFAKHFPDALLTEAGIDPGLRAEAVGLELWIRLTNLLKEKGIAVHRGDAPAED
jgi:16S rRNA (adenine1518-N6/adenine1519-N6)-dimethyltransferase